MLLILEVNKDKAKALLVRKKGEKNEIAEEKSLSKDQLYKYIGPRRKKIKEVRVIGSFENMTHRVFELPPAKGKLLRELVRRELKGAFHRAYLFGHEVTGEVKIENTLRKRVFAVGVDIGPVKEVIKSLKEWRLEPSLFTTYPLALRAIYKKIGREGAVAFLHIDEDDLKMTFISDSEVHIYRALQRRENQDGLEHIKRAMLQTLNFYSQEYPGNKLKEIVLLGKDIPDQILKILREESKLDVTVLEKRILREYPEFIGATLISPKSNPFNFLPREVKERKTAIRVGVLAIFLAFSLGSQNLIQYLKISQEINAVRNYKKGLETMISLRENEMASYAEEMVEYYLKEEQPPWYPALLELAAVIPPDLNLIGLKINREETNWRGEATGTAENLGKIEALREIQILTEKANRSPLFKNVSVSHTWNTDSLTFTFDFSIPHTWEFRK